MGWRGKGHSQKGLLGGNKNGQDKDIKQAQKIFRKYAEEDISP